MSKFVTLVLEPRFNDEYGEYANLPVFNAHGDVVGYTGGEVPETGNPCEFYVMDEEGFPVCHSASENAVLRQQLADVTESMGRVEERCAKLREYIERKQHLQDFARLVTENSKLRELVKMMLLVCKSKGIVGGVFSQPNSNSNLNEQVNFESCACELGIEVD